MDPEDLSVVDQPAGAEALSKIVPGRQYEAFPSHSKLWIEQAEARIEQAEKRTEQAEARTEEARTRTEQAVTGLSMPRRGPNRPRRGPNGPRRRPNKPRRGPSRPKARSARALLASELSYRRLFEAAQDGILILDADTGRITDVNPFLVKLLGFSRAEMTGKTVGELSPFKDIESNQQMLERLQRDGYARYEDLPLETRDGRHIAVEFVSNVYTAGEKQAIQCNIRDITARKQAENEVLRLNVELDQRVNERTAELLAANQELEGIQLFRLPRSARAAAPYRRIRGNALRGGCGDAFRGKLAAPGNYRRVGETDARLDRRPACFLAHRKSRDAKDRCAPGKNLLKEVLVDFQVEIAKRHITWKFTRCRWSARSALLRLVFVNLISNALKFHRRPR